MSEEKYIKLWLNYKNYFAAYSDAEIGRLVRGMFDYVSTGKAPEFTGNERFIWPVIQYNMDMSAARMEELSNTRRAARKGKGKQTPTNDNKEEQTPTNDNKEEQSAQNNNNNNKKNKEEENIKERERKESGASAAPSLCKTAPSARSRFIPPSVEEVRQYCLARRNGIDAEQFISFYASKNWYVGKNKMTDWKAAIITWEKRRQGEQQNVGAFREPHQAQSPQSWSQLAAELDRQKQEGDGLP